MTTFAYSDLNPSAGDFTLGTVVGVVGPQLSGDPESYVAGRRFAPANGSTSWNGLSYLTGRVDRPGRQMFLDLSNALQLQMPNSDPSAPPLVPVGTLNDIGRLRAGLLKDPTVAEFTPASADNFLPIGEIDYRRPGWLLNTGGVVALPLTDEHLASIDERPLALAAANDLNAGSGINAEFGTIALRETIDGLFVEAEPIVHRIDPPGSATVSIRATRYGLPLVNTSLVVTQVGRVPNQGGGDPRQDQTTPVPDIGAPSEALQVPTAATDPGNPRKYIDGQLYLVDFRTPGQGNQARSSFDYVVVHGRDAFTPPATPTWDDIAQIMTQYANLYPVMSRGMFDLANQAVVDRHARMLRLAFALPIDDPNHMPVTRDLSAPKRAMILAYLDSVIVGSEQTPHASAMPTTPKRAPARPIEPLDHVGGKTRAAHHFARATGLRQVP